MQSERFWARVNVGHEHECWFWRGSLDSDGYGRLGHRRAHRIAYELTREPIPEGLTIDHLCRTRHCVNPAHLEVVDTRTNVLRGEGITAQCARKTHCTHGHAFTAENTYLWNGARHCKTCRAERRPRDKAAWRARRLAA